MDKKISSLEEKKNDLENVKKSHSWKKHSHMNYKKTEAITDIFVCSLKMTKWKNSLHHEILHFVFLKCLTYSLFLWNWVSIRRNPSHRISNKLLHLVSCDSTVHIWTSPKWPSPALFLIPQPPPSALALWPRILAWWQICWHHHMFTPIHMHTQYNPSTEGGQRIRVSLGRKLRPAPLFPIEQNPLCTKNNGRYKTNKQKISRCDR